MDMQTMLNAMMAKSRQESLSKSPQLTLGELILKVEAIENKEKPIAFDFDEKPSEVESWRGSYAELAVNHVGESSITVGEFLHSLKEAVGKTYEGYKGGDFTMSRHTPVWVANYSESSVSGYKGKDYVSVGITDITDGDTVIINTDECEL